MLNLLKNQKIRSDSQGDGHYLAKRGNRLHRGVDYIVKPFEEVYAPFDCKVIRIARPYSGDTYYKGLVIQSDNIALKIFYISPVLNLIGKKVKAGTVIAYAQDISKKYSEKMTPHIHVEVMDMNVEKLFGL